MVKIRYPVQAYLCLSLTLLLLTGCDQPNRHLVNGEPVPGFALNRLDGTLFAFPESVPGKPAVIEFWADWCSLCLPELRNAEAFHQANRERGTLVIAINIEQSRETVQKFIAELGLSFELLLDQQGEIARRYGVVALPVTFIVDRDGNLYTRILGGTSPEQLQRIVDELL